MCVWVSGVGGERDREGEGKGERETGIMMYWHELPHLHQVISWVSEVLLAESTTCHLLF